MLPITPPRGTKKSFPDLAGPSPLGRKVLPLGSTASLSRSPGHKCDVLVPPNTEIKTTERVAHFYASLTWTDVGNCRTWDGPTRLNGDRCHCKCQACHNCVRANLYDDKLPRVIQCVEEQGYKCLSPFSQKYAKRRLDLSNAPPEEYRATIKKLSRHQKKSSFADTDFERQRNTTFANPPPSNRVDMYLERRLRSLENELSDQCHRKEITVSEGMKKYVRTYMDLLEQAQPNLQTKQKEFEEFVASHKKLEKELEDLYSHVDTIQIDEYSRFIAAARTFLKTKETLHQELPGAPRFLSHFQRLNRSLKSLVRSYDQIADKSNAIACFQAMRRIDCFSSLTSLEKIRLDLKLRLEEVEIQMETLKPYTEKLPDFDKIYFGVLDKKGVLRTPTREQIQDQFLAQVHRLKT